MTAFAAALAVLAAGDSIATRAAETPHERLFAPFALFAASDEANLQRNPIAALFGGDLRFADRFGEYLSDACFAAERGAAEAATERTRLVAAYARFLPSA